MKTKNDFVILLDKELNWYKENPANISEDFRFGFIAGLEQAKRLIKFGEIVSLKSVTPKKRKTI